MAGGLLHLADLFLEAHPAEKVVDEAVDLRVGGARLDLVRLGVQRGKAEGHRSNGPEEAAAGETGQGWDLSVRVDLQSLAGCVLPARGLLKHHRQTFDYCHVRVGILGKKGCCPAID